MARHFKRSYLVAFGDVLIKMSYLLINNIIIFWLESDNKNFIHGRQLNRPKYNERAQTFPKKIIYIYISIMWIIIIVYCVFKLCVFK